MYAKSNNITACILLFLVQGFSSVASAQGVANPVFAVNCGGDAFTSSDGTEYTADTGVTGGSTYSSEVAISETADDVLFQSERYGDCTYSMKVPNGHYRVTLCFAETYHDAAGLRSFDVVMEGSKHISGLDIHAEVGANAAYTTETNVNVSDGELNIDFVTVVENAKINAIKVVLDGLGALFSTSPEMPVAGQAIHFDAAASSNPNGTITSYFWDFGDGATATGKSVTHSYSNTGSHAVTLKVNGSDGESGSLTRTVAVHTGEPIAGLSISPANPKPGDRVRMDASASYDMDGTINSYHVDYGDGTTADGAVTTHTYPNAGNYAVTLKVTDNDGKSDSLLRRLSVREYLYKPRIINTTDLGADPDDEQSMVRFLACSNEFDVEGLIVATGCWKKSQSNTGMLDKIVNAYEQVYDNLKIHAEGYPTPEYLKSISVVGQRGYGMSDVGAGKDSPGSELIIAAVDKDDPRPVWVGGWGGVNNVAQAVWKVRETRSEAELAKFISKLRVFDILGQDDAGAWLAKNFPDLFYIRATGVYGWQPPKNGAYQKSIQSHGPLGAVYPDTKYATEGDTPAFMHVYPNGLNDPDQIDQGGWGGRFSFTKKTNIRSMSGVSSDSEMKYAPYNMYGNTSGGAGEIKRWSTGYDNDFEARMDWTMTGDYAKANHHPVAVVNGDVTRQVLQIPASAGSRIQLSTEGSSDPDGDALIHSWSFYKDPGSYDGNVNIENSSSASASVIIPADAAGSSIHVILELHDNGSPSLYAYRRVIINVR